MSVGAAVGRGLLWVSLSTYARQVVEFGMALVLAGLLAPEEFGVFAMASLIVGWLGMVRDLGFGAALIHNQDDIEEAGHTAFTLIVGTGVALFLCTWAAAPWAARFFATGELTAVLRVLAFSFIIISLRAVQSTMLQKRLMFKMNSIPPFVSSLTHAAIAVTLALRGYGVWSIVIGSLVSNIVLTVHYWIISPFRPQLRFNPRVARSLVGYGNAALLDNIFIFLLRTVDRAAIGRILGVQSLGYYDFAHRIGNLPATRVTRVVSNVMFPVFSKLQNDVSDLRATYLRTIRYLAMIVVPLSIALAALGPSFAWLLYASKWMPAMRTLQILVVYGVVTAIGAPAGTMLYSLGHPKDSLVINLFKGLCTVALIYHAVLHGGIIGVALLFTSVQVIAAAGLIWRANALLGVTARAYLSSVGLPVGCALLVAGFGGALVSRYPMVLESWGGLIALSTSLGVVYGALLLRCDGGLRSAGMRVRHLCQERNPLARSRA